MRARIVIASRCDCWRSNLRGSAGSFRSLAIAICLLALTGLLYPNPAFANNLNISNAVVASQDTSNKTLTVQFDISWDNSWRDNENFDAVWVFVKYSTDVVIFGDSDSARAAWGHAIMRTAGTNPSGFSRGSGTELDIVVSNDRRGFFLQRSQITNSPGTVSTTGIQVLWDYNANGLSDSEVNNLLVPIKIFGVEMVYVPQGSFYLGDNTSTANGEFTLDDGSDQTPCPVNTETSLDFAAAWIGFGACRYTQTPLGGDDLSGSVFTLGQSFPKGFQAFYLMKYEITQGQYAEFLNTLSRAQQVTRVASTISGETIQHYYVMSGQSLLSNSNRNTVTAPSIGNGTSRPVAFGTSRPYRAMNYMSWMDLTAFADWAALRPMSELEYEKAARGPVSPTAHEYAWGSTTITASVTISGTEDGTERVTTANANAVYNNTTFSGGDAGTGPLRVGISSSTNISANPRLYSGSGYYGNMELTGNVWERTVTVGNSAGRSFAGTHGDGVLTTTASYEGNATLVDWPGINTTNVARGVTGAQGSGFRGGAWITTSMSELKVSGRRRAAEIDTTRGSSYGGRLVRTVSA